MKSNGYQNMLETNPEALIQKLEELKGTLANITIKYIRDEITIELNDIPYVFNYISLQKELVSLDLSKIPTTKGHLVGNIRDIVLSYELELERFRGEIQRKQPYILEDADKILELICKENA